MPFYTPEIARFALLIARLRDAEVLTEKDGATLQFRADEAYRSQEAGDEEAVRRHLVILVRHIRLHVAEGTLPEADSEPLLRTVQRILASEIGSVA